MNKNHMKPYLKAGLTALAVILVSLAAFFTVFHIQQISALVGRINYLLRPIYLGLVFAFLLLPVHKRIFKFLCERYQKKHELIKSRVRLFNGLSIMLSLIFAFAVLYILFAMVMPQVSMSIVGLVKSIPDYIDTAGQWIMRFLEDNPDIQQMVFSTFNPAALTIEQWLNNELIPNLDSLASAIQWVKTSLLPNITGVISNVSSLVMQILLWLKDIFIGVIVSVYLLASKDIFAAQSKKIVYGILPPHWGDLVVEETRNAYRITSGFINGKLLDSLIIGIITFFCCTIFNFPYPSLIAMIIGVTNIIPFFGPFIGAIPSAFLILLVDPIKCLYFSLFVFLLQQFDGNILGPKILGESTGLASFWVLFSIILFGGLFGFPGMVLGVPVFAIIYSIVARLIHRGLRKKKLPVATEDYIGQTGRLGEPAAAQAEENTENGGAEA